MDTDLIIFEPDEISQFLFFALINLLFIWGPLMQSRTFYCTPYQGPATPEY